MKVLNPNQQNASQRVIPTVVTPKESDVSIGKKEKNAVLIKNLLTHDKYHVFLKNDDYYDQKISAIEAQNQSLLVCN